MDYLKNYIDKQSITNIFSATNKIHYLKIYLKRMKDLGADVESHDTNRGIQFPNAEDQVIRTWDFDISVRILRDMYRDTEKYKEHKYSYVKYKEQLARWKSLCFGPLNWPFSPAGFDRYVANLIRNNSMSESDKDVKIQEDVLKYKYIRAINQYRGDYVEYRIFEANDCIIPCFGRKKGFDYYYKGWRDQKFSRPPKEFIEEYGSNWHEYVAKHPRLLAKYFYTQQDEIRFGYESRVYIVAMNNLHRDIKKLDFTLPATPTVIEFSHKNKKYKNVECFIKLI
jgi:hypothetical protein